MFLILEAEGSISRFRRMYATETLFRQGAFKDFQYRPSVTGRVDCGCLELSNNLVYNSWYFWIVSTCSGPGTRVRRTLEDLLNCRCPLWHYLHALLRTLVLRMVHPLPVLLLLRLSPIALHGS